MKPPTDYPLSLWKNKSPENKNSGFTLLEIIAVMSLFLLVVVLIGSVYQMAQKIYTDGNNHNELIQNARVCLDRLSRELRQASNLVSDLSASSSEIFFQDGHESRYVSYIRYYLDGTNLMRDHTAYYFGSWPVSEDQYVRYNTSDLFGAAPSSAVLSSRIIGEYFDDLDFSGAGGLVGIQASLNKGRTSVDVRTKAYIRNW